MKDIDSRENNNDGLFINPNSFYKAYTFLNRNIYKVDEFCDTVNKVDESTLSIVNCSFENIKSNVLSMKKGLEKLSKNIQNMYDILIQDSDFANTFMYYGRQEMIEYFGEDLSEDELVKNIYQSAMKKDENERSFYEKYIIDTYGKVIEKHLAFEEPLKEYQEQKQIEKEIEKLKGDRSTIEYLREGSEYHGYPTQEEIEKYDADIKKINDKIKELEKKYDKYKKKALEDLLVENEIIESTAGAEFRIAVKKIYGSGVEFVDAVKSGNWENIKKEGKEFSDIIFSTDAVVTTKIVSGVAKLGEWADDGLKIAQGWIFGGNLVTGIDLLDKLAFGDEGKLKNNKIYQKANENWNEAMDFVSKDRVGDAQKYIFEETNIGKQTNEASALKYDGKFANATQNFTTNVAKYTAATVVTAFTGIPVITFAVGAVEGLGKNAEQYFSVTDENGNYKYRNAKGMGLSALGAVEEGANWYIAGNIGNSVLNTAKILHTQSASQVVNNVASNLRMNKSLLSMNLGQEASKQVAKEALITTLKSPYLYIGTGANVANAIRTTEATGEFDLKNFVAREAFILASSYGGNYIQSKLNYSRIALTNKWMNPEVQGNTPALVDGNNYAYSLLDEKGNIIANYDQDGVLINTDAPTNNNVGLQVYNPQNGLSVPNNINPVTPDSGNAIIYIRPELYMSPNLVKAADSKVGAINNDMDIAIPNTSAKETFSGEAINPIKNADVLKDLKENGMNLQLFARKANGSNIDVEEVYDRLTYNNKRLDTAMEELYQYSKANPNDEISKSVLKKLDSVHEDVRDLQREIINTHDNSKLKMSSNLEKNKITAANSSTGESRLKSTFKPKTNLDTSTGGLSETKLESGKAEKKIVGRMSKELEKKMFGRELDYSQEGYNDALERYNAAWKEYKEIDSKPQTDSGMDRMDELAKIIEKESRAIQSIKGTLEQHGIKIAEPTANSSTGESRLKSTFKPKTNLDSSTGGLSETKSEVISSQTPKIKENMAFIENNEYEIRRDLNFLEKYIKANKSVGMYSVHSIYGPNFNSKEYQNNTWNGSGGSARIITLKEPLKLTPEEKTYRGNQDYRITFKCDANLTTDEAIAFVNTFVEEANKKGLAIKAKNYLESDFLILYVDDSNLKGTIQVLESLKDQTKFGTLVSEATKHFSIIQPFSATVSEQPYYGISMAHSELKFGSPKSKLTGSYGNPGNTFNGYMNEMVNKAYYSLQQNNPNNITPANLYEEIKKQHSLYMLGTEKAEDLPLWMNRRNYNSAKSKKMDLQLFSSKDGNYIKDEPKPGGMNLQLFARKGNSNNSPNTYFNEKGEIIGENIVNVTQDDLAKEGIPIFEPSGEKDLFNSNNLPLSSDPELRKAQEKVISNQPLSIMEKVKIGHDTTFKELLGYKLKSNCAYRAVSKETFKKYKELGYIVGLNSNLEPVLNDEYIINENNKGVDWYLGGAAPKYGKIIIECPADKNYFILAKDFGSGMSKDPSVRFIKSSGSQKPIPFDKITRVIDLENNVIVENNNSIKDISLKTNKDIMKSNTINRELSVPEKNDMILSQPKEVALNSNNKELSPYTDKSIGEPINDKVDQIVDPFIISKEPPILFRFKNQNKEGKIENVVIAKDSNLEKNTDNKKQNNEDNNIVKYKTNILGKAIVTKVENSMVSCKVLSGLIRLYSKCRIIRNNVTLYESKISALQKDKINISEVCVGLDCTIFVDNFNLFQVNDIIEAYEIIKY